MTASRPSSRLLPRLLLLLLSPPLLAQQPCPCWTANDGFGGSCNQPVPSLSGASLDPNAPTTDDYTGTEVGGAYVQAAVVRHVTVPNLARAGISSGFSARVTNYVDDGYVVYTSDGGLDSASTVRYDGPGTGVGFGSRSSLSVGGEDALFAVQLTQNAPLLLTTCNPATENGLAQAPTTSASPPASVRIAVYAAGCLSTGATAMMAALLDPSSADAFFVEYFGLLFWDYNSDGRCSVWTTLAPEGVGDVGTYSLPAGNYTVVVELDSPFDATGAYGPPPTAAQKRVQLDILAWPQCPCGSTGPLCDNSTAGYLPGFSAGLVQSQGVAGPVPPAPRLGTAPGSGSGGAAPSTQSGVASGNTDPAAPQGAAFDVDRVGGPDAIFFISVPRAGMTLTLDACNAATAPSAALTDLRLWTGACFASFMDAGRRVGVDARPGAAAPAVGASGRTLLSCPAAPGARAAFTQLAVGDYSLALTNPGGAGKDGSQGAYSLAWTLACSCGRFAADCSQQLPLALLPPSAALASSGDALSATLGTQAPLPLSYFGTSGARAFFRLFPQQPSAAAAAAAAAAGPTALGLAAALPAPALLVVKGLCGAGGGSAALWAVRLFGASTQADPVCPRQDATAAAMNEQLPMLTPAQAQAQAQVPRESAEVAYLALAEY